MATGRVHVPERALQLIYIHTTSLGRGFKLKALSPDDFVTSWVMKVQELEGGIKTFLLKFPVQSTCPLEAYTAGNFFSYVLSQCLFSPPFLDYFSMADIKSKHLPVKVDLHPSKPPLFS